MTPRELQEEQERLPKRSSSEQSPQEEKKPAGPRARVLVPRWAVPSIFPSNFGAHRVRAKLNRAPPVALAVDFQPIDLTGREWFRQMRRAGISEQVR